jgi:hypothetical protein
MVDNVDFGCDINSSWEANPQGDFLTVFGVDNAIQAVYNRLMTKLNELNAFGYINYGNQSDEVIGSTDIEVGKQLIILYTTVCLLQEPRVQDINSIDVSYTLNGFECNVNVQLIGEDTPTNIIFTKGG